LINVLTDEVEFLDQTVTFPDFSKNNFIKQEWEQLSTPSPSAPIAEIGRSYITAIAQEYDQSVDLMDVPAGADFFVGQIKLSRTTAPSHAWLGLTIAVIPPTDKWISFMGGLSMMVEQDFGFGRMIHVYMDGGKLKLARQQS